MNVHDSERMAGLLEPAGYEPRRRRPRRRPGRRQHLQRARERRGQALHAARRDPGDGARDRPRPDRGRDRLRGAAGRRGAAGALAGHHRRHRRHAARQDAADAGRADARSRARVRAIDVTTPYDEPSFPLGITRRADPVKAYVTIIEGCNDFCAFCVVPYTRGHERMRAEGRDPGARSRKRRPAGGTEVQLLGQIVNHYHAPDDPACDFPALLEAVHDVPGRRAHPVRQPASAAHLGPPDRGGARPAQGLQAPAPAGAVRLDAGAPAHAPSLHARRVSGHGARRSGRLSRTSSFRPI